MGADVQAGQAEQSNFDAIELARMPEAPKPQIEIIWSRRWATGRSQ
jgi:hypothetical protein